jgi:hypothetical protein
MENYREIVSEYVSAVREKNAEKAAPLLQKLHEMDSAVGVRSTPYGSYTLEIPQRKLYRGLLNFVAQHPVFKRVFKRICY